jgi:hypothetical protein
MLMGYALSGITDVEKRTRARRARRKRVAVDLRAIQWIAGIRIGWLLPSKLSQHLGQPVPYKDHAVL